MSNQDNFVVGSAVKISDLYRNHYEGWNCADKIGTVESVKLSEIPLAHLNKEGLVMYQARYGKQLKFPTIEMVIAIDSDHYIVSQFGVDLTE